MIITVVTTVTSETGRMGVGKPPRCPALALNLMRTLSCNSVKQILIPFISYKWQMWDRFTYWPKVPEVMEHDFKPWGSGSQVRALLSLSSDTPVRRVLCWWCSSQFPCHRVGEGGGGRGAGGLVLWGCTQTQPDSKNVNLGLFEHVLPTILC